MSKQLAWECGLREEYPKLFSGYPSGRSIEISPGWNAIVERILARLDSLSGAYGRDVIVAQIKQKFGRLTIYLDFPEPGGEGGTLLYINGVCMGRIQDNPDPGGHFPEIAQDIVSAGVLEASRTCEQCAAPGEKVTLQGYVAVLCPKHIKEREGRFDSEG